MLKNFLAALKRRRARKYHHRTRYAASISVSIRFTLIFPNQHRSDVAARLRLAPWPSGDRRRLLCPL